MSRDDGRARHPRTRGGASADAGRNAGQSPAGSRRGRPAGGGRAERTTPASAERWVAADVLQQVREQDAYANLALPALLREARLTGRDAAFATELTYGTLRLQGRYDPIIDAASGRSGNEIDPPVRDVLRLTAHQLFGMRVPAHAAVSQAVDLAAARHGRGAGAFVNAVGRRMAQRPLEQWLADVAPQAAADEVGHLAVVESHPAWVVRALMGALAAHGRARSDIGALLRADNRPARVTLVARPGLITPHELREQIAAAGLMPPQGGVAGEAEARAAATASAGASSATPAAGRTAGEAGADAPAVSTDDRDISAATPGVLAPTAVELPHGDPGVLPAVVQGRAAVQDEGSQLVAHLLAGVELDGSDAAWLDLCAGPGGKAALLGALARQRGARLVANESQPHRADLVRQACIQLGDTVDVRVGDGRDIGSDGQLFDRILVDAPCTGLGALRRRPEARWRRQPSDVAVLAGLQRELLAAALEALRPGGVLAYVTCSPHAAETEVVVADAVRRHPGVHRIDLAALRPDLAELSAVTPSGALQLWPDVHGTDAMYLALLSRA